MNLIHRIAYNKEKSTLLKGKTVVKIHILGGPGSGKTTLAQSLSSRFHVPHYDLDRIGWKHGADMAAHVNEAIAIAEQPKWITEGIHIIWTDVLLYQVDYIVLLDVSWPVAAWRIILRHVVKSLHGTNPYKGVKSLFNFLQFAHHYYKDTIRPDTSAAEAVRVYLAEQAEDIEPPNTEILVARLTKCMLEIPITAEFVRIHLEKYKDKVVIVKNNADRERLFKLLVKRTRGL